MAHTALETFWEQIAEILPSSVDSETAIKLYEKYQECKQLERVQLHKCASFWRGKECEIEKQIFDEYYTQTYNQNK